jgi:hypothetical protein
MCVCILYTYDILIISYYIHISELQNKFKIFNLLYSKYTYIYKLKDNGYVTILKIQK